MPKILIIDDEQQIRRILSVMLREHGYEVAEAETGVSVTAFCPGPTASGFQDKAAMHHSGMVNGKRLPTSEAVARRGFRAMQRGRRVYIPGLKNWLLAQLLRVSPRRLVTRIVIFVTGPVEH